MVLVTTALKTVETVETKMEPKTYNQALDSPEYAK